MFNTHGRNVKCNLLAPTYFVHHRPGQSHVSTAEYQHAACGFLVLASRHLLPAVQNSVNTITLVNYSAETTENVQQLKR